MSNEMFRVYSRITATLFTKINSQLNSGTIESITATNLTLKTSQHEIDLKHDNFTVSNHIIYSNILVAIAQKHLTA